LIQHCEVVSLDDAVGSTWAPDADRPRVAITFDDAYRGAVTIGVAELVRRGLPATLFVAPAFIGGRSFWWDALGESFTGGLPESVRRAALEGCQGIDSTVRRWAQEHFIPVHDLPTDACAASEEELLAASRAPRITLGAHTWSHPNLPPPFTSGPPLRAGAPACLVAGKGSEALATAFLSLRSHFSRNRCCRQRCRLPRCSPGQWRMASSRPG
jgi:peptidoglycan/xylan/chitin deacetylase (PgdA/CDA1 family)